MICTLLTGLSSKEGTHQKGGHFLYGIVKNEKSRDCAKNIKKSWDY